MSTTTPQNYSSASLYVGELNTDVSEAMLFDIFKQVGPVASIRVCRDAVTRRSLGYAYVNFHNVQDAERALDTLNYHKIGERPCRIMWSHRDPSKRKSGAGNIFIKNLDKSIDHQNLNDTFSAFGNILSCKVELDAEGISKGYGYVHYETVEEADAAIAKVNGMLLAGQKVTVSKFKPKKEREAELQNTYTNIFVKNLPIEIDDKKLKEVFGQFGEIQNAAIMVVPGDDGKLGSKGFGFVNYTASESARKAVAALHQNKETFGQEIFVGRAQKKKERQSELRKMWEERKLENLQRYQGVNLYVKNLDDTVDEEVLRKEFAHCGTITSTKIMRDEKDNTRGFGFVCFSTPDEATKAVTEMNGAMIANKPIYVALAQRKEIRRAQLEAQHASRMQMRMQPNAGVPSAMYPASGPVYFPPGQPRMPMYPNMTGMPRPRWQPPNNAAGGRPGFQQMNFVGMPAMRPRGGAAPRGGRPAQGGQAKGRGGAAGRGGNARYNGGNRQFQAAPPHGQIAPLSTQELASQPPEEAKLVLGDRLYHSIAQNHKDKAGKITGMLLESMDNTELILLLEDKAALDTKVQEALEVLRKAEESGAADAE